MTQNFDVQLLCPHLDGHDLRPLSRALPVELYVEDWSGQGRGLVICSHVETGDAEINAYVSEFLFRLHPVQERLSAGPAILRVGVSSSQLTTTLHLGKRELARLSDLGASLKMVFYPTPPQRRSPPP